VSGWFTVFLLSAGFFCLDVCFYFLSYFLVAKSNKNHRLHILVTHNPKLPLNSIRLLYRFQGLIQIWGTSINLVHGKNNFLRKFIRVRLKTSEISQIKKEPSETRHREGA
jgi:hypothetical protein